MAFALLSPALTCNLASEIQQCKIITIFPKSAFSSIEPTPRTMVTLCIIITGGHDNAFGFKNI